MESALRPAGLKLIETFRWEPAAGFVRLPAHLARMAAAGADYVRRTFSWPAVRERFLGAREAWA